jgi:iron-sulfur cluster assembly protein
MLVMTEQAVEVIRGIVEDGELGPGGGLRISATGESNGESALEFELAAAAQEGDEVVREGGAVVFLDERAAAILADKTLDVHAHGDHFHFSLDEQEAEAEQETG